jgi:hypothetical protein
MFGELMTLLQLFNCLALFFEHGVHLKEEICLLSVGDG